MADALHHEPAPEAEPRLPLIGYVAINAVVWAVCACIWFASKTGAFSSVESTVERPGTAIPLLFVCLAFLAASAFDYFFDGVAGAQAPAEAEDDGGRAKEEE